MNNKILIVGITLLLSGCATQATLHINTQPIGGYVTELGSGAVVGLSPNAVTYYDLETPPVIKNAAGCYVVRGMTVQWVSGAVANTGDITLCGQSNGTYNLTVNRPNDYQNVEADIRFALEIETLLMQQKQAASQNFLSLMQSFQAQQAQRNQIQQSQQQQNRINCRSVVDKETIRTNCR